MKKIAFELNLVISFSVQFLSNPFLFFRMGYWEVYAYVKDSSIRTTLVVLYFLRSIAPIPFFEAFLAFQSSLLPTDSLTIISRPTD